MSILKAFLKEGNDKYQSEAEPIKQIKEKAVETRIFKSPDKLESLSVFVVGEEILGGSLYNKEKDNKVSLSKGELLKFYVALKQARYPNSEYFYSKHSSPITNDLLSILNVNTNRIFLFKGYLFNPKLFSERKFNSNCLTDDKENFDTEECLQKQEKIFTRNIEYVEDKFEKSVKSIKGTKDTKYAINRIKNRDAALKEFKIRRKTQTDEYMEEYRQLLRKFKPSIFISYNIFEREIIVNFLKNLFYTYKLYS